MTHVAYSTYCTYSPHELSNMLKTALLRREDQLDISSSGREGEWERKRERGEGVQKRERERVWKTDKQTESPRTFIIHK